MALTSGSHIGPYEILGSLGAGGMGEVYRARDERLRRIVAIKVLPADALIDLERRQRFVQEAQAASALNHPNIVHIYGIESGAGHDCIVMEYIDGRTLDEVVRTKQLSIREVLECAVQIADALATAHAAGIVHRDIKPGNIMVTAKGLVKVLDFGLAKLADAHPQDSTRTMAPKTRAGAIIGTAPYMSPEQAQGQPVDARSDIFSFGTVLYELLTGRRAFAGTSDVAALSAVLNTDPRPASESVRGVSPALDHILTQCLRKDPRRRIQRMDDVKIELEQIREDLVAGVPARRSRRSLLVTTGLAGFAITVAAAVLIWIWPRDADRTEVAPVTRLTFDSGLTIDPALSPDGTLVAYASDRAGEGNLDIWIQQVAGREPIRVTRDAAEERTPTFSPDGTRIAYRSERDGGGVYVMPALGGEPTLLASGGFEPRFSSDGRWVSYHTGLKGADDGAGRFLFASAKLFVVPAEGGQARQIQATAKTATAAAWSPDSRHLLIVASFEQASSLASDWWVTPLEGRATKVERDPLAKRGLATGAPVAWLPGNRIVFPGTLGDSRNYWIVTLSDRDWQIDSAPERLTTGAGIDGPASASMADAPLRLAFSTVINNVDLWSVSLSGDGTPAGSPPIRLTQDAAYDRQLTMTRDGRTLIYASNRRRPQELWLRDLVTGRETLLASPQSGTQLAKPVISADGSRLAFWREEGGGLPSATFVVDVSRASDGSLKAGSWRQLPSVAKEGSGWPWSWSPNGGSLWYDPARFPRLEPNHLYDVARGERVVEFGHPTYDLAQLDFSPDGQWLAFEERFDDGNGRLLITRINAAGLSSSQRDWIEIARGDRSHGWHGWSPAGDVLYYESSRDGSICVWSQRLQPGTMRPVGEPVAIYHAHSARLSIGGIGPNWRGFAVARHRIVFNMSEMISNIWMTELQSR